MSCGTIETVKVDTVIDYTNVDKIEDSNVINDEDKGDGVNDEIEEEETEINIEEITISNDNSIILEDNSVYGDDESNKDKSNNSPIRKLPPKKRRSKKITANNETELREIDSDKIVNNRSSKRQKAVKDMKDCKEKEAEEALLATIDAGGDISDVGENITGINDKITDINSTTTTPTSKKRRASKKVTIVADVISPVSMHNTHDKVEDSIDDNKDEICTSIINDEITTYLTTPTTLKATPKRRASKKPIIAAVDETVVVDPIAELSPEAALKLTISRDRIQALTLELSTLEQCSDLNDINLDAYQAMDELFNTAKTCYNVDEAINKSIGTNNETFVTTTDTTTTATTTSNVNMEIDSSILPSIDTATTTIPPVLSIDTIASDKMFLSIRQVLARAIQGSTLPLSKLVPQVIQVLSNSADRIRSALTGKNDLY
jgi:hypothetical protein